MRHLLPIMLLLAACGAQPPPTLEPAVADAPPARLSNGLALRVEPRPGAHIIVAHLALPAGSSSEGEAHGAAALTQALVLAPLRAAAEALGGTAHAWVDHTNTHLQITAPADALPAALDALAAAGTLDALSPEQIRSTATTLDLAQAQAQRAAPRQRLHRLLGEAAPTRAPALPGTAALAALTADGVQQFHRRRYVPDGAVLLLLGDVQASTARTAAGHAFAQWKGDAEAPPALPLGDDGPRIALDRGPRSTITAAYSLPIDQPGAAAQLDLLAQLLTLRLDATLTHLNVRGAHRAWPLLLSPTQALLIVELSGVTPEAGIRAIASAAIGLSDRPPSSEAIGHVADALRRAAATREDDLSARASRLGTLAGHWPQHDPAAYEAGLSATPEVLASRAARLQPKHLTAVITAATLPKDVDPALWGERLGELAATAAGRPQASGPGLHTLAPGVEVVIHPMPGAGTVTLYAATDGGQAAEHRAVIGVAGLIAAGLAQPGPDEPAIHSHAGHNHIALWATVHPKHISAAVSAVARRVHGFRWRPDHVETARATVRARTDTQRSQRRLQRLWWPPAGDDRTDALSPSDLQAWYAAHVAHAPLRLVVAGDIQPERALRMLRPLLVGERDALGPVAAAPEATPKAEARGTTDAALGQVLTAWPTTTDTPPALAAAELLGALLEDPKAPLHEAAHRDGRATITPLHRLDGPRGLVGIQLQGPLGLLGSLRGALEQTTARLGTVVLEPESIQRAQRRLVAQKYQALQSTAARAHWLAGHARSGRALTGPNALHTWKTEVERITPKEIGQLARDLFKRDHRLTVEIGRPRTARSAQ
jgi:predicted Zn-dependent peptidase